MMETAVVVKLEDLEKEISEGRRRGLLGALQIGRALKRINENNLFLVAECKDIVQYSEKVWGFKRSSCYNLIAIYETWGQAILANPEFQAVDPTRLIRLLPLIETEDKEELLRDAVFIPDAAGFENNLRNRRGEVATDDEHEHAWQPIPWEQCSICKQRRKIKEAE